MARCDTFDKCPNPWRWRGLAHHAKLRQGTPNVQPARDAARRPRKELGSGKRRYEVAMSLGIRPITVAVQPSGQAHTIEDGIEAVRSVLPRMVFDEVRASKLFADLQGYRKAWDEKLGQFRSQPLHDDTSHGADAVRTGALMTRAFRGAVYEPMNPEAPGARRAEVRPDNDGEV